MQAAVSPLLHQFNPLPGIIPICLHTRVISLTLKTCYGLHCFSSYCPFSLFLFRETLLECAFWSFSDPLSSVFGSDPSKENVLVNVTERTTLVRNPTSGSSSPFDQVGHILFLETVFHHLASRKPVVSGFLPPTVVPSDSRVLIHPPLPS